MLFRSVGRVTLRSVFGHTTNAPLVKLTLQLNGWYDTLPVSVLCAIADINTSRYDVILPQDVVNQLHERSVVKVNSVLIGAVTVNTACDDVAVSPVVSHCGGDITDVPVITDNKPMGQSYVSEGSQRRKLEVTPRSLLVVRKEERKTLEPTWWCKSALVCVMMIMMMIMMNMLLMTTTMLMRFRD